MSVLPQSVGNAVRHNQLTLTAIAALFVVVLFLSGSFDKSELSIFDDQTRLFRDDIKAHPDVVVVMIDDQSLYQMRDRLGRWPWPRIRTG